MKIMIQYNMEVRTKIFFLCLGILLFFALPDPCQAEMKSSHYKISQQVFAGSGSKMQSTSYINQSTFGQPSPIGVTGDQNYINSSGFWPSARAITENNPRSLPWLMLLLGE